MGKYCKNCGAKLDDDDVFCDACGTKFGEVPKHTNVKTGYNPFNLYNVDMIDGEKVIRNSEIHAGCLLAPGIVLGVGLIIGFVYFIEFFASLYYDRFFVFLGFFNVFTIVGLIWLIIRFISYSNTDLILTNKRVFGKCGLISTTQMQAPLNMINSVSFTNGLMGKIMGYGTVRISSASTQFKFRFIKDGQTLYNDIFNQLEIAEKEKMVENAEAIADAIGRRID